MTTSRATSLRTDLCGTLRASDAGRTVSLCGWVHRRREHSQHLAFVDLRDHYGISQLVVLPTSAAFAILTGLRVESVVRVDGHVVERRPETVNHDLATGSIEIRVDAAVVLGEAQELPLPVFGEPDYPEEEPQYPIPRFPVPHFPQGGPQNPRGDEGGGSGSNGGTRHSCPPFCHYPNGGAAPYPGGNSKLGVPLD